MKTAFLVFPHQLFEDAKPIPAKATVVLIEEFLFFRQYAFHKQKLAYHRATMRRYEQYLRNKKRQTRYIESNDPLSDIRDCIPALVSEGFEKIVYYDPTDCWLEQRLDRLGVSIERAILPTPLFINTRKENAPFFRSDKKKFFQTKFYKQQRIRLNLLLEKGDKPVGGKWSFDAENRKKYPRNKNAPPIHFPETSKHYREACRYVEMHFPDNPGDLSVQQLYPIDFKSSKEWLDQFIELRFAEFGAYEDAIVIKESFLHHSVLTPMLNIGLLLPHNIIYRVMKKAEENNIPINSLEGFVRQIIGWREFIRGVYEVKGSEERTKNYWGFSRKIPSSFYDGTTGIVPVDNTIRKVLKTGYCHHIERLMILGNFMLLCEFHPDEVYRWFMELFIDAYDWVMVPNVYGMSQFADGGLMSTKPYISGSNYLMKMSNYKKGEWQKTWDGLFWRFMHVHRDFFLKNPRLGMLIRTFDKMSKEKKQMHLRQARKFIKGLQK